MRTNIFLLVGAVTFLTGVGTAVAGPCTARIDEVSKQLASRDAGSGPVNPGATQGGGGGAVGSTGAISSQSGAAGSSGSPATPREVPVAGQTPKTEATPAMNAATQGRATSPADVRAQTQGQPTSAQVAQGEGSSGPDAMRQSMTALERARTLDREGKEADCMSAVQEAGRLSGNR